MMIRRIVVAGCRNYENYAEASAYISSCIAKIQTEDTLIFLSGGCRGADQIGERYAEEHGYALELYPAQWERYGRRAGPVRNRTMAEQGDYFICFWDGKSRGTGSLIRYAQKLNKPVSVFCINGAHQPVE